MQCDPSPTEPHLQPELAGHVLPRLTVLLSMILSDRSILSRRVLIAARSCLTLVYHTKADLCYHLDLTCSCLTMPLLKSSGPVYVPSVTRQPPSMCSSRKLRSRSLSRACRSFSSFLASRSCFVSRGRSGAAGCASRSRDVRPRKLKSGLLPRPCREL